MLASKLHSFSRSISTLIPKCKPVNTPAYSPLLELYCQTDPSANVYKYNRAIDNSVKSGDLDSALQLFDEMPVRDVVTWNILISGHGYYGFAREALYLYVRMVSQGIIENSSTFSSLLSICCKAGLYREGIELHCRLICIGFSSNVYVGSALVDLYMHIGFSDVALRLFDELPGRNLATWNLVLRGLCELGRSNELLELYYGMKLEGVVPNPTTFCYLIRGFGNEKLLEEGKLLHSFAVKMGWSKSNIFVDNALVDFYSACGSLIDAKKLFELIPLNDVISWNSIVSVFALNGFQLDAIEIFRTMQLWGKKPSIRSFVGLLNSSSANQNLSLGKQIHCYVLKVGFIYTSVHVQSSLIDMYGKCRVIEDSVSVYQRVARNLETCNSLMTSLLHCGITEDVIELFGLMVDENIGFDETTLSTTLKALSSNSVFCMLLHCCAIKSGLDTNQVVSCSLIDAYSRSGQVKLSQRVFQSLTVPNLICFTSILNAYARNGMGKKGLETLEIMIQKGPKPDRVTFLCVLSGCSHSGLVEEGKKIFDLMKNLCVYPDRRHYSCMVDLLGRAGLVDEAEELLEHVKGHLVIWSSLLRSCRVYRNEEVGRRVAKVVMELEPKDPAVWLQCSNFYAEIGDYETSMRIREVAVARNLQRDIGCSLIEVNRNG